MNVWLEVAMVFVTIGAAMVFVCRVAWQVFYYVLACKNPLGKTVTTAIAALWLMCAGLLAII